MKQTMEVGKYFPVGGGGGKGSWRAIMGAGMDDRAALLASSSALLLPEEMDDRCV